MSPEQAAGETDIDTRSDVYALGAILYEILTGSIPLERERLKTGNYEQIRQMIREEDPPRPSTRVSMIGHRAAVAARRRSQPGRLVSRLHGDLDWITLRALEKDRSRRYDSPFELAADLQRHLRHEPVLAGPPGVRNRAGKFVRRNRALVVGTAATVMALIAGIVFSVNFALAARAEREKAEQVVNFQSDLLENLRVQDMGRDLIDDLRSRVAQAAIARHGQDGAATTMSQFDAVIEGVHPVDVASGILNRNLLIPADATVEEAFSAQPEIEARLRITLARMAQGLDLWAEAYRQARQAFDLATEYGGAESKLSLQARSALGVSMDFTKRRAEGQELLKEGLKLSRESLGNDHPRTLHMLNDLARIYVTGGQPAAGAPLLREIIDIRLRTSDPDDPAIWRARYNLAHLYWTMRDFDNATRFFSEAMDSAPRVFPDDPRSHFEPMAFLGAVHWRIAQYEQAEPLLLEAMDFFRESEGMEDYGTSLKKLMRCCIGSCSAAGSVVTILIASRRRPFSVSALPGALAEISQS